MASSPEEFVTFLPEPRSQFTRYRSWNSRMYPVWKDGDPRFRNCWFGEAHSSVSKDRSVVKFSLQVNMKMLNCV